MTTKKLTPRSLENSALHHLKRHASTVAGLKRILVRKVDRGLRLGAKGDRDECLGWIDALLVRLEHNGYLNDARYAEVKSESMLRRGSGVRLVAQKLQLKGVPKPQVQAQVAKLKADGRTPDLEAAIAYAKRRKLGPWRTKPMPKDRDAARKERMKALASLARRGFGFELAKRIVDAPDVDALEG